MANRAPRQQKLKLPAAGLKSGRESVFIERSRVEALPEEQFFALSPHIEHDAEETIIFRDCDAVRAAFGMERG